MSREKIQKEAVVFTCDQCGKQALAGSEDLLQNWEKGGRTAGKDEHGVWRPAVRWDYCGACK